MNAGEATAVEAAQNKTPKRRERGTGRIWLVGRIYWIQYYCHGRQIRESSKSETKAVAERRLEQRLVEVKAGQNPGPKYERVKYEELRDGYYSDCLSNAHRSLRRHKDGKVYFTPVNSLNRFFKGYRAVNISTDTIRKYREKRTAQGVRQSTINREVRKLSAMFHLALKDGKLRECDIPAHFPMVKENNARKGFFDKSEFLKLRDALPAEVRTIFTVAYYTGMRLGEIVNLKWSNVDFLGGMLRLDADQTKTEEGRSVPLTGELLTCFEEQYHRREAGAEFVFVRESGERIRTFYRSWGTACKKVDLSGKLFHDLRRTGVRNLIRAGVPQSVAMDISGHKTISVFKRYNITSDDDKKEAAAKLEKYIAEQKVEIRPENKPDTPKTTATYANA